MPDRKPLSADDWLKAAFRALTRGGPQAIMVEAIARDLGVSKGSFYWHFKDISALKSSMLQHWQDVATANVIAEVEASSAPPREQLQLLLRTVSDGRDRPYGGVRAEAAIRDWARYDRSVAPVLKSVDERRLDYLRCLFEKCGLEPRLCASKAAILYGGLIGLQGLSHGGLANLQSDVSHLLEQLLR